MDRTYPNVLSGSNINRDDNDMSTLIQLNDISEELAQIRAESDNLQKKIADMEKQFHMMKASYLELLKKE